MEHGGNIAEERYVGTTYIREHLMVSRTKAYEIAREIEEKDYGPGAVVRFGRCLRVRKDVFHLWVSEHGVEA